MRRLLSLSLLIAAASAGAAPLMEVAAPADIARSRSAAEVRLVNLWATWCVPCVAEMDDLVAIDRDFADARLQILGVSLDDAIPGEREETKRKVTAFLKKQGIGFQNLYYTGKIPLLQEYYGFEGEIPMTLLYDRSGEERARYQGRIDPAVVRREIDRLLNEK